jgi:hypothetical protein
MTAKCRTYGLCFYAYKERLFICTEAKILDFEAVRLHFHLLLRFLYSIGILNL